MFLSDRDIERARDTGQLYLYPYDQRCLQPTSYDCHLHNKILLYPRLQPVRSADPIQIDLNEGPFELCPGLFILASTEEYLWLGDKTLAMVEGKSSLGRQALMVHQTAGFIDPGFHGQITLEMTSSLPIRLEAGMPICQLVFAHTESSVMNPYGKGRDSYNGQLGPTPPRTYWED